MNHLPPGFCKHGPCTCPQIGATAHLLQTFLPSFPWCQVMLWAQPRLLGLPSKTEHKLSPSLEEAEGRKQPPVDSGGGKRHTNKPQNPTTFNYHLCTPPPLAPAGAGVPALACLKLQFPRGTDYTYVCVWVIMIRLVGMNPHPILSVARRERSHRDHLPVSLESLVLRVPATVTAPCRQLCF